MIVTTVSLAVVSSASLCLSRLPAYLCDLAAGHRRHVLALQVLGVAGRLAREQLQLGGRLHPPQQANGQSATAQQPEGAAAAERPTLMAMSLLSRSSL